MNLITTIAIHVSSTSKLGTSVSLIHLSCSVESDAKFKQLLQRPILFVLWLFVVQNNVCFEMLFAFFSAELRKQESGISMKKYSLKSRNRESKLSGSRGKFL